jgi:hypothetical protein
MGYKAELRTGRTWIEILVSAQHFMPWQNEVGVFLKVARYSTDNAHLPWQASSSSSSFS